MVGSDRLLLVHGGSRDSFDALDYQPKLFVADPRLRTRDHPRELQSVTAIFHALRDWLSHSADQSELIYFSEYDHLPLVPDLNARQLALLQSEGADVLGYGLMRIDGTSHPHYLHHVHDRRFETFLGDISVRIEPTVVLTMLGTGSVWRREAFEAVASRDEPFPMYQEIYLPSVAHHLGFRVRGYGGQDEFVSASGERTGEIEAARARGAWTLHPVKDLRRALAGIQT